MYEPITRIGEAAEIARAVSNSKDEGIIKIGNEEIGISHIFEAKDGVEWSSVGVIHDTLNKITIDMMKGKIINVDGKTIRTIRMTTIGELFTIGPLENIIGHISGKKKDSGAFAFNPVNDEADCIGKYRSLWAVQSKNQTKMTVLPTHKGEEYTDKETCKKIWEMKSRLFYIRRMRWTASKITSAITKQKVMGGAGWISLSHKEPRVLAAFCLWANSIYGMLAYWNKGGKTQHGRSMLRTKATRNIPCPKFDELSDDILDYAQKQFDILSKNELKIANQAAVIFKNGDIIYDEQRENINKAVTHMLGVPENYDTKALSIMFCSEPSVKSKKKTRFKNTFAQNSTKKSLSIQQIFIMLESGDVIYKDLPREVSEAVDEYIEETINFLF